MVGWMISRQYHVNKVIATQLWNSGEYRKQDYSYYTLLAELNQKSIQKIQKEFGE